jgi:uncharacterized protein (DUF2236 family)
MSAYHATRRPLSVSEKNRYLAEQAVIGRMGGAGWVPETVRELDDYVEAMRPRMEMNAQTRSFLAFLSGTSPDLPMGRAERFDAWLGIRGSMSLMPEWARRMTGTWLPRAVTRTVLAPSNRLRAALVRWAYPELPCKRMALARVRSTRVEQAGRKPLAAVDGSSLGSTSAAM